VKVTAPALLALAACASTPSARRFEYAEMHMGTFARIVLYAPSPEAADAAARAAFAEIARLDRMMSDYRTDSELNSLPGRASPELIEVLSASRRFSEWSDGAFDVTVGPLVADLRRGRPPTREALSLVGWRRVEIDGDAVRFPPGTKLDLGAIAKGYAADRALRALGHPCALVEIGGDLALGDPPPGGAAWRIALPDGRALLASRCGVACSGHAERGAHIVDPRTGTPVTRTTLVVLAARNGMTADALATALSVLAPQDGLRLANRLGAQAFIRGRDGHAQTEGFAALLAPR